MSTIPALDRGLAVVEFLVLSGSSQRYVDIKKALGTISDASLNRLLSSLVGSGYIAKDAEGRYVTAPRMDSWSRVLAAKLHIAVIAVLAVRAAVAEARESAAFGLLTGERIEILASESCHNSVTIIAPGQTLHFEADHVGSLAILDTVWGADRSRYEQLLSSTFSRMKAQDAAIRAIAASKRADYYSGEAQTRVGISRVALPFCQEDQIGVLFITMPSERLVGKNAHYAAILRRIVQRFQNMDAEWT